MAFVRWLCLKFTRETVSMKIGSEYIEVHIWMTGAEEGFFVSDLSQRKARLEKAREIVREMEEEFEKEVRS